MSMDVLELLAPIAEMIGSGDARIAIVVASAAVFGASVIGNA